MSSSRLDRQYEANEHAGLAKQAYTADRLDEAIAHIGRAIAVLRALLATEPADAQTERLLAGQLENRAGILGSLGSYPQAIADASEALRIYQRLEADWPSMAALRATAQGRLGRMLAFAGPQADATAGSAREHAAAAVRTYRELVATDPAQRSGLAHMCRLEGDVLLVLDGAASSGSLAAYAAAVAAFRELGPQLSDPDQRVFAEAALRLAYGLGEAERLDEAHDAAREAVEQQQALAAGGDGANADYVRALYLLGTLGRELDDPEGEQSLVDAAYVISVMTLDGKPLPADVAAMRDQLEGV
ncbi:hypothetical protein ACTI_70240 [Actinoplanes sp. OR16]|uniref:hypothetical protein n=1 Tax=Actinoplanes sp. OR16 TaxID=946334 RepID=UPI000F6CFECD|nr:hypothetical protein [Actinoplanes sp. OR16]BBH70339.1 hypothetical protein ACTI_70240 [Actinoplanes sp. OR16]